jgi:hypothetical protein
MKEKKQMKTMKKLHGLQSKMKAGKKENKEERKN